MAVNIGKCERVTSWQTRIPTHFMIMKSADMFSGGMTALCHCTGERQGQRNTTGT